LLIHFFSAQEGKKNAISLKVFSRLLAQFAVRLGLNLGSELARRSIRRLGFVLTKLVVIPSMVQNGTHETLPRGVDEKTQLLQTHKPKNITV
jgi:hypothetical protein